MADLAEIDAGRCPSPAAIALRALERAQRIVAAGREQARERQRTARNRQPAVFAQRVGGRIARRERILHVRRRGQQRALDRTLRRRRLRPVRHHHHARAVGDEDHRPVDGAQRAIQRFDARGATELVLLQRRHGVDLRQLCRQQRLPVFRHVLAQAGDDEDGGVGGHAVSFVKRIRDAGVRRPATAAPAPGPRGTRSGRASAAPA